MLISTINAESRGAADEMRAAVAIDPMIEETTEQAQGVGLATAVLILLAHAPLAWLMSQSTAVSTLHALVALTVGAVLAFAGRQKQVAYAAAYIAGAEVLWRMTDANVFWEFGKYATVAILVVALLRARSAKLSPLILLYFVFLVPSVVLTITNLPLSQARQQISFNLSGPLSLLVSAWFFSSLQLQQRDFEKVVTAFVAPMIGVATLALSGLIRAGDIQWTNESNFAASGGFGPNQVSSALALGVLLIFLFLLSTRASAVKQAFFGLLGLWFLAQTALTFSRGGFVTTAVAVTAALLHALLSGKHRGKAMLLTLGSVALVAFLLFPYLDRITGGALASRYADADLTNREVLARDDLEIFLSHPIAGVGPGMAKEHRSNGAAAHTEFTRVLAEHGIMGILAVLALMGVALRTYWRASRNNTARATTAALTIWVFVYMLHSAMRLVSVSLAFGLAFAALPIDDDNAELSAQNKPRRHGTL